MSAIRKAPKAWFWGGLGFALFATLALIVNAGGAEAFDSAVIAAVQGRETDGWTAVAMLLSELGSTIGVIAICATILLLLAFVLGHRSELVLFVAAVGGAVLLNQLLKLVFRRERPDLHRLVEETGFSFPSGHAMAAFALYAAAAYLLWRHIRPATGRIVLIAIVSLMIVGIGLSRIYLGVHYPSDVVAGYVASGVWLGIAIAWWKWRFARRA
ncbi:phosphatase PAP2 family protein [Paenibacillaceae bacterium WGS1546]|uniref:phosphatase PAP2 family protein n=1 Tax=Cohnella sp. WGS1546 TaxID=3366810 RepID=UPI00372D29BB